MINGRDLKEWIGTIENFYLLCWISKGTCVRKKRNNQLVLWQRPAQLLSAQLFLGTSVLLPSLSSLNKILQHSENYYYIKNQNKPLPIISKHYHIEFFPLCRQLCSSQDFFFFFSCVRFWKYWCQILLACCASLNGTVAWYIYNALLERVFVYDLINMKYN